jgi:phospholipid/cholesterol/gamma-HCH transport system substrate-binding protein
MENKSYALAAGLFTLLLGFGVVAATLWFNHDTVETQSYLLVSHQPVSGLNPQAPVRYRGVTVGRVDSIDFDPKDARAILIKITVNKNTPLMQGVYAQLGSQGITGLSYVVLDDDGASAEPLVGSGGQLAQIEVRPSFIDNVSKSGEEVLANFNQVGKRVNTLLNDENQKQLVATLRNLEQVSGALVKLVAELQPTVQALPGVTSNGTVLLEDIQRSTRSLERLVEELREQPQSLVFGKRPPPPGPGEPGFASASAGGTR